MAARQSDDARKLMPDERAYRQAISEFSALMFRELSENVVKRGNFMNWYPTAEKAFAELDHHVFKLAGALGRNNPDRITEYCADIANICLGINREFGTSPGPLTE